MNRHATVLLALVLVAGACAMPTQPTLEGRDFLLVELTTDGAPQQLVEGTRLRLSFADEQLAAHAGCNHLGATYAIHGGRLQVGQMSTTEMGCPPDLHAQDERLANFLASGPRIALDGDRLVLEGESIVATFRDRQVVQPDPPLAGTTWQLDGLIDGDAVSSVPGDVVSTLQLGADGSLAIQPGCNQGGGTYELGDGTILFGPIGLTRMACPGARDQVEAAVLAVLSGEVEYEINAGTLTLRAGERGLQFSAR